MGVLAMAVFYDITIFVMNFQSISAQYWLTDTPRGGLVCVLK